MQVSQALSVTFAQFTQTVTANQFQYNDTPGNPGLTNPAALTAVGGAVPVNFQFNSFLNGELTGNNVSLFQTYAANLVITAFNARTGEATPFSGNNRFDTIDFSFVGAATPANTAAGIAGKTLLRVRSGDQTGVTTQTAGTLAAGDGNTSGTFQANNASGQSFTTGNRVRFSSDVIDTTALNTENYALSFSSVNTNEDRLNPFSGFTYDFNNVSVTGFPRFLESFNASGTGTFAATFTPVPEPGTMALAGSLIIGGVFSLRRRRARK